MLLAHSKYINNIYINHFKIGFRNSPKVPQGHPNDDYFQPGTLYSKVMNDQQRTNLINNIAGNLKNAKKFVNN